MERVTLKDILIPAGTKINQSPHKREYFSVHMDIDIGFGKDFTGTFTMDISDAEDAGIIEQKERVFR